MAARGPTLPPSGGAAADAHGIAVEDAERERRKEKKSRKERQKELRDDGFKKSSGVDYSFTASRHMDDTRFERAHRQKERETQVHAGICCRRHRTADYSLLLCSACLLHDDRRAVPPKKRAARAAMRPPGPAPWKR